MLDVSVQKSDLSGPLKIQKQLLLEVPLRFNGAVLALGRGSSISTIVIYFSPIKFIIVCSMASAQSWQVYCRVEFAEFRHQLAFKIRISCLYRTIFFLRNDVFFTQNEVV